MDKYELKRHFLPIFHEIQMKMINLSEQEDLITDISQWNDNIGIEMCQHYQKCPIDIRIGCNLYSFLTFEENERRFAEFKSKVRQKLGIVL